MTDEELLAIARKVAPARPASPFPACEHYADGHACDLAALRHALEVAEERGAAMRLDEWEGDEQVAGRQRCD